MDTARDFEGFPLLGSYITLFLGVVGGSLSVGLRVGRLGGVHRSCLYCLVDLHSLLLWESPFAQVLNDPESGFAINLEGGQ